MTTKFDYKICLHRGWDCELVGGVKIYCIFMIPKPTLLRLSTSMQPMDMNWQIDERPEPLAVFELSSFAFNRFGSQKELKLKLSLERRNLDDVIIVYCQGRIVYRDEAAALSRVVGELLEQGRKVVLDLSGVSLMDSAGIGELAQLQSWAQAGNISLKCAAPNRLVSTLLALTNLDSVLEVHPSVDVALASFHEEQVWAD
jgi:anti-sigma B factor antagonist